MRAVAAVILALSLSACEGPAGPAGPQGPPGANGVANRVTILTPANASGDAYQLLPVSIGSSVPAVSCYRTTTPPNGPWYLISDGTPPGGSTPWCYIEYSGTQWQAVAFNVGVGGTAAFVVTY
jgi:hypothetical protein